MRNFAKTAANMASSPGRTATIPPRRARRWSKIGRQFLDLKARYPQDQYPTVAGQLEALNGPFARLEQGLSLTATDLKNVIREISFSVASGLRAAIDATRSRQLTEFFAFANR